MERSSLACPFARSALSSASFLRLLLVLLQHSIGLGEDGLRLIGKLQFRSTCTVVLVNACCHLHELLVQVNELLDVHDPVAHQLKTERVSDIIYVHGDKANRTFKDLLSEELRC